MPLRAPCSRQCLQLARRSPSTCKVSVVLNNMDKVKGRTLRRLQGQLHVYVPNPCAVPSCHSVIASIRTFEDFDHDSRLCSLGRYSFCADAIALTRAAAPCFPVCALASCFQLQFALVESRASWLWRNRAIEYEYSEQGWAESLTVSLLGRIHSSRPESREVHVEVRKGGSKSFQYGICFLSGWEMNKLQCVLVQILDPQRMSCALAPRYLVGTERWSFVDSLDHGAMKGKSRRLRLWTFTETQSRNSDGTTMTSHRLGQLGNLS